MVDPNQIQRVHQSGMPPPPFPSMPPVQIPPGVAAPEAVEGDAQRVSGPPMPIGQPPAPAQPIGISGQPGQKMPLPSGQPPAFPSSVQAVMSMQQRNNRIAPVAKPQGLDPLTLLNERENRYGDKMLIS